MWISVPVASTKLALAASRGFDAHLDQDHLAKAVQGDTWAQVFPVDKWHLRNTGKTYGRHTLCSYSLLLQTDSM